MKNILLLSIILLFSIYETQARNDWSRISTDDNPQTVTTLLQNGISLDNVRKHEGRLIIDLDADEINRLKNSGVNFTVEIADLRKYYENRNAGTNPEEVLRNARDLKQSANIPIPQNFTLGSMGGYSTLQQAINHLDTMRAKFPNLISVKQSLTSELTHEGRQVYWVRISDNPDVDEAEPEVLFTALHHAREPIGLQQMLFFMYHILENYESDPLIKRMLDTTELYFVPCLNPDGYEYNRQIAPAGGGSWRKNRRDNGGSYGVDLNRNYGFEWGYDDIGSSPDPTSNTYRGPSAFSEPETRMISDFCIAHEFQIALNYHSYGNWLLNPWGYIYEATPDQSVYDAFNYDFTQENAYIAGPASLLLYAVNGGSDDWMYAEQSLKPLILAYTPEIGTYMDGFWPQLDNIIPLCQQNVDQNMKAALYSGWFGKIKDLTSEVYSSKQNYVHFSVQRYGLQETEKYKIYIEPVSSNIISVSDTIYITNPVHLQTYIDSLYLELSPDITNGNTFQFNLHLSDGVHVYTQSLTKVYGFPLLSFSDPCSDMSRWISSSWNLGEFNFFSPPFSITDSKYGNYGSGITSTITLKDGIELPENQTSVLSFKSWYEIERGYDYVILELTDDNGISWNTLASKNTRPGTAMQTSGVQIFDGNSNEWLTNEIQISQWAGKSIKLRFTLKSNYTINKDGFYFDNVEINTFSTNTGIHSLDLTENSLGNPVPNPARTTTKIPYQINESDVGARIVISDSKGQKVFEFTNLQGRNHIDLSTHTLSQGIYFIHLISPRAQKVKKLIIQ